MFCCCCELTIFKVSLSMQIKTDVFQCLCLKHFLHFSFYSLFLGISILYPFITLLHFTLDKSFICLQYVHSFSHFCYSICYLLLQASRNNIFIKHAAQNQNCSRLIIITCFLFKNLEDYSDKAFFYSKE